jgi:hypothetical protein
MSGAQLIGIAHVALGGAAWLYAKRRPARAT